MQAYLSMKGGASAPKSGSFTSSFSSVSGGGCGLGFVAPGVMRVDDAKRREEQLKAANAKLNAKPNAKPNAAAGGKKSSAVPPQAVPPEVAAAIAANWKEPPPEFVASLTDKERIVLDIAQRVQAGFFDVTATQIYVAWKEKQAKAAATQV